MKFLELRQKDVINCNTGECLGFVLDLEFEIHTGKICYLISLQNPLQMHCKDRQRYDSSRYQRKRMPEIKEKLSFLQKK